MTPLSNQKIAKLSRPRNGETSGWTHKAFLEAPSHPYPTEGVLIFMLTHCSVRFHDYWWSSFLICWLDIWRGKMCFINQSTHINNLLFIIFFFQHKLVYNLFRYPITASNHVTQMFLGIAARRRHTTPHWTHHWEGPKRRDNSRSMTRQSIFGINWLG